MRIPVIRGTIDRRILVNYRVDPDVLANVLPPPFRPKTVNGVGIAGVCLIRLVHVRPRRLPPVVGMSSENAAHRIAVEWDDYGERRSGVFIPRRGTSSRFNSFVGGRLFPGEHYHARYRVDERDGRYRIVLDSDDGRTHVAVDAHETADLPKTSTFGSLEEASSFFEQGALGYSVTRRPGRFDGLELRCFNWQVQPLAVETVESNYFEDRSVFPPGAAEFDCALLMRGIDHEWHGRESLQADERVPRATALRPC